ncbi:hypothetical protein SAMN05216347_101460 [Streptococcus equinus]|uniref:Uncharacterized protein n=2 Tax=Streptococcus equinus TaxID=1335 RepID=A0A1H0KPX4_STREI|nr:hypothetical protein SAMN05216347_101460 [Streptococcus equinus]
MLKMLLIVLVVALVVAGIYNVRNQLWVSKTFGYDYVVVMKNGAKLPDLASNAGLKGKIRVVGSSDDTCSLQSHLNDVELKKVLMSDYNLAEDQVYIRPAQLSGAVGMM